MKLGCFFLQFTHSLGTVWTHFAMIEYIGRSGSTPCLGEQKSTEKRHLESNVKQYVSTNIQGIICCTLWLAKDHVHDCHRRIPYSSLHFLLLIRFKALYRGRLSQMCPKNCQHCQHLLHCSTMSAIFLFELFFHAIAKWCEDFCQNCFT